VCDLLATTTLNCVPSPCADTCVTTYNDLVAANAICGSTYLALLTCGETKPADSWLCYTVLTISTPVPPYDTGAPTGCQTEFTAFSAAIIANLATCGAVLAG
jgi:hypothetical protein